MCISHALTFNRKLLGKFWTVDTLFFTHSFKDVLARFIFAIFQQINWQKYNEASGVPSLSKSTIEKIKILLPHSDEQRKIANFLGAVDEKIAHLLRTRVLLEDYKKGCMQKLFSQELRFKDNNGHDFPEWEPILFSNIAFRVDMKFDPCVESDQPTLIELDNIESRAGRIINESSFKDQKSVKTRFESGDVLFGKLRPYLKKFARPRFAGVCSSEIWVLRSVSVSNDFLFQLIQTSYFNQLANMASGTKMPRSDWKIIADSEFDIPHPDEQRKIADFLAILDKKISLLTGQCEQVKTFKKGLLQQMFI
ncbi:MAG: restriction endonuclease subunit S [Alphaproteobacteria bacterium]|nr:restriction endonuclease subunit S [Alphaproteobacteria bacterium]